MTPSKNTDIMSLSGMRVHRPRTRRARAASARNRAPQATMAEGNAKHANYHDPCDLASDISERADAEGDLATFRYESCLLYTSPSPRDQRGSRMPSSA